MAAIGAGAQPLPAVVLSIATGAPIASLQPNQAADGRRTGAFAGFLHAAMIPPAPPGVHGPAAKDLRLRFDTW